MSLYDVILKELDLNEGDEFETKPTTGHILRFEKNSLLYLSKIGTWELSAVNINELFDGITITKRAPWVPKIGDIYYVAYPITECMYAFGRFENTRADKFYIENNLVFKTKEEAISCAKKMLEAIK